MAKVNLIVDAGKKDLVDKADQAITDLTAIIDAPTLSNAEAMAAIKELAQNQRGIIRVMKKAIEHRRV